MFFFPHRAQYRHTNLPDCLIPCRFEEKCQLISKKDHQIKYFHGEKISNSVFIQYVYYFLIIN